MLPCPPGRQRVTPARLMGLALPAVAHRDLAACAETEFIRAFKSLPLDWMLLGPHVRYVRQGYLRKRLHRNRHWEMLLVCWLPGQHTVIHDHGDSWSATRIVCGEMSEIVYGWRGEGKKMRPLAERTLPASPSSGPARSTRSGMIPPSPRFPCTSIPRRWSRWVHTTN